MSEQSARTIVRARSGGRCEVCGREAQSVHHRMKQGRPWHPANLLALCGDGTRYCHGWIEAHPLFANTLGLWVPRGVDPRLRPVYCKPEQWLRRWWLLDDDGCLSWPEVEPTGPDFDAAIAALTAARLATI